MTAVLDAPETTVNVLRVTTDMMTAETERAATRLRDLILEIGEEMGHKHGWKMEASRRTGIHQTYVAKLLSQERTTIGLDAVARVAKKMGISKEFFHSQEKRSYKQFKTGAHYAAWTEFLDTPEGRAMRPHERTTLSSVKFAGIEPTVGLYLAFLFALRGHMPHTDVQRAARATDEQLAQIRRNNRKRLANGDSDD